MNFLGEMAYFKFFRKYSFSSFLLKKREESVYNALENKFSYLIDEYKDKKVEIGENSKKIWFMRWKGIDDDNIVVKKCFESANKYSGNYEVILITEDNFTDYVDFPQIIIDKVNDGRISLSHLSDLMRSYLLSRYGGIWADSTMLFFDGIFNEFDDIIFNSPSFHDAKWCSFFIGGKPNKLFSFLYDFYSQYHSQYDEVIDYLLVDHGFKIAYNNFEECREYIDNNTLDNSEIFYFLDHFSDTYEKEEFDRVCNKYKFFKISDKPSVNAKEYDEDGNLTNFGYLKYKLKF